MSECKHLPQEKCIRPQCTYVNARQYCRTAKNKKKNVIPSPTLSTKKRAIHKITRFIKKNPKFRNMVCADSLQCVSFGNKIQDINHHFQGFKDFKYVESVIPIGDESANGFVREIKYTKNGYSAYSVLKSTAYIDSDNLVYEYVVGIKFINRMVQQYPCFVYTYGLYFYKSDHEYLKMKNYIDQLPGKDTLIQSLELQKTIDYAKACVQSKYAAILIQHLNESESIKDSLFSNGPSFIQYHLTHVLFILYHALANLSKIFTHYDLHSENVLLFRPYKDKVLEYVYHMKDTTITFKCPFIPKIIDYGRCHFDNGNVTSKKVYDKICSVPECGQCGEDYGFTLLDSTPYDGISVQQKNESHDLRLAYTLPRFINIALRNFASKNFISTSASYLKLERVLRKVKYGVGQSEDEKRSGTEEDTTLHPKGDVVANVTDMFHELKKIVKNPFVVAENTKHVIEPIAGQVHIYEDGRTMTYISMI
jgi:hypothetical protein